MKTLLSLLVVAGLGWGIYRSAGPPPRSVAAAAPLLEQVRQLGELATLRVTLQDIQLSRLEGLLGAANATLVAHGEALVGADLERAAFESVDAQLRQGVLVLPQPRPLRARIDPHRSRVVHIDRTGLWSVLPGEAGEGVLIQAALQAAEQRLLDHAAEPRFIDEARRHAQNILGGLFREIGWSVEIRWEPGNGPERH